MKEYSMYGAVCPVCYYEHDFDSAREAKRAYREWRKKMSDKSRDQEIKRLKNLLYEKIQELRRLEEENRRLRFTNSTLASTIRDLKADIQDLKQRIKRS